MTDFFTNELYFLEYHIAYDKTFSPAAQNITDFFSKSDYVKHFRLRRNWIFSDWKMTDFFTNEGFFINERY